MHDLTAFQRDCLYVIAGLDTPKGLEVGRKLKKYYERNTHHSQLYPNLDTLVEMGLVEKGEQDKRTNSYSLTKRGRQDIIARRKWESQVLGEEVNPCDH